MGCHRQALISGTVVRPQVRLCFGAGEVHAASGQPLSVWVRGLPRARRVEADGSGRCVWLVLAFGPDATVMLTEAGFDVAWAADQLAASGVPAAAANRPLAEPHPDRPDRARVFPRLAGITHTVELLGNTAVYEPATGTLSVPRAALIPPPSGVTVSQSLLPPSWPPALPGPVLAAARRLAAAPDLAGEEDRSAYAMVAAAVGDIPDWFGLDLDPYQRAGALAAAAGHTALCDPPGLGKTRTILAALAATGSRRSVIVTPPFPVVTHWERETAASRLAEHTGPDGAVVTLQARRKLPALPSSGVVLVPDTLLAARPEVVDLIASWAPDGFAVDEVHRAKTWEALRSQAVRQVARSCSGIRMAASGTPMLANAHEMGSMLAICGHLTPVFGGLAQFEQDFCVQNKFGWSSRKRSLPRLKLLLDEHVWVRRPKVMATTKRRYVEFIDPDTAVWSAAHAAVNDTIDRWLHRVISTTAAPPDDDRILAWARTQLGLITQMRRAAGLAKVDGIAERATAWVQGYTSIDETTGAPVYERPLIIWTWHQEVSEALAKAVPAKIGAAGVIIGSTKPAERSRLVDAYQAGEVSVLVCSIPTVGVGVTLTRGCDAWVAEVPWTPSEISQAEDRQHRRGQDRDVVVTTFIAPGTLDERVQDVLAAKGSDLDVVLSGGDNDVAVLSRSSATESANLLLSLVHDRIPVVSRRRGSRAA